MTRRLPFLEVRQGTGLKPSIYSGRPRPKSPRSHDTNNTLDTTPSICQTREHNHITLMLKASRPHEKLALSHSRAAITASLVSLTKVLPVASLTPGGAHCANLMDRHLPLPLVSG